MKLSDGMSQSKVDSIVRDGRLHFLIEHEVVLEGEERLELFRRRVLRAIAVEEMRIECLDASALKAELVELIAKQDRQFVKHLPLTS